MNTKVVSLLAVIIVIISNACVTSQEISEPEKNFEFLWKAFDRNYALFEAKQVDWHALYRIYRPRVTARTSDPELFVVIKEMLGHLNDNHVSIRTNLGNFSAGILQRTTRDDFSLSLVKSKYLDGKGVDLMGNRFHYGWLNEKTGYFHFRGFSDVTVSSETIDKILAEFKDAEAIVVDVRGNGGGDDRVGKAIADRFSDRKRLYMTTRIRMGENHGDFTPPLYWYAEPDGRRQFTGPVVLLTHRYSVSAADNFALAMRVLPNVTLIGDFTSGCYADQYGDRLPNGWRFSVSFKLFEDQDGFCWEGIGVPPDLFIKNSKEDIDADRDRVLEFALDFLAAGPERHPEVPGSLENQKLSRAEILYETITAKGIETAIKEYWEILKDTSGKYFSEPQELFQFGEDYLRQGKHDEAIAVLEIAAEEFPGIIMIYGQLARAYIMKSDRAAAAGAYQQALKYEASAPWERDIHKQAREFEK